MRAKSILLVCAIGVVSFGPRVTQAGEAMDQRSQATAVTEVVRYQNEYSRVRIAPAPMGDPPGLMVVFEGTNDLHYYARSDTAPAPDLQLTIEARSDVLAFNDPVFPKWEIFNDAVGDMIEVYVGNFAVPVSMREESIPTPPPRRVDVEIKISGIACTSQLCLPPFEKTLVATLDLSGLASQRAVSVVAVRELKPPGPASPQANESEPEGKTERQVVLPYGTAVYYLLAILAGLSINIMPCVLPVIPLIMMRLIDQSRQSSGKRIASGMAFCAGVILFFAAFALVSAIINLTTGAVLDLNSLFRYPVAVIVLFLAILFFGLAMLDVVTLSLPSTITGKQGSGSGVVGSAGMGFFAGILSTPCSGALLGFVLVWAQTQPLLVSSTAIVLMGVGMALPYAVIVLVPSLLERVPKPGNWMEFFKKSTGFLLFFIAAKLTLAALPKDRLLNVLTYGIIFSFCVWMWGKWVGLATPAGKKWTVRLMAVVVAVATGFWLLPAKGLSPEAAVDWQKYDADSVRQAASQERPVVLKFTADWCTNCKIVDKKVYQAPEVARLIKEKNVLPIKADTTLIDYPATVDLKTVYGEAGNVPVTIVLLPNGTQTKLRGIFNKERLLDILEQLPEGKE